MIQDSFYLLLGKFAQATCCCLLTTSHVYKSNFSELQTVTKLIETFCMYKIVSSMLYVRL